MANATPVDGWYWRGISGSTSASDDMFRLLVASIKDYAIFLLDPDGVVKTWNIGAQRIKGYRASEIVGHHFSCFYTDEEVRTGRCEMELKRASLEGRFEDEGWQLRADGSRFWANVTITALKDADGNLLGFAKITRDLTERHAAEQARERQAHAARSRIRSLALLSEALASALSIDDVGRAITDQGIEATKADTCAMYLLNDGSGVLELTTQRGGSPNVVERTRYLTRESGNPTYAIGAGDAEGIWVESAAQYSKFMSDCDQWLTGAKSVRAFWCLPLVAEKRKLGMLTVGFYEQRSFSPEEREFVETFVRQCAQAVARAHRLETERRVALLAEYHRREADRANRAKDDFLAWVSHELRSPLNAILGWVNLLSSGQLDEQRRAKAIDTIERNSRNMAQLIEDLLDISRVISGKMNIDSRPLSPHPIVTAALDSVRPLALEKGIEISSVLDPEIPLVAGDPTRLQQVVTNLVNNAVKFTPSEGSVNVTLLRCDDSVEITVSDTGQGIDPDFLPKVFDAFRQEDASASRTHGGLGLGLAIAKQLVELHHGHILAKSEGKGCGATFTVSLPTIAVPQRVEADVAPVSSSRSTISRPERLRGLRVLVVDDDEDSRTLVAEILKSHGCRVTQVSNVPEALASVLEQCPDLLLSDIAMPGEDGYGLIRKLRSLPQERGGLIPAAALTAYARAEDRRGTLAAGYSIHLPKPIDPTRLISAVSALARMRTDRPPGSDAHR